MDGDIVVVKPDQVTYRASALGGCLTSLVAARMEYTATTPPEKLQRVYDSGHEYEDKAMELMYKEGWTLWDKQAEVVLPLSNRLSIVGHIDGKTMPGAITPGASRSWLCEVKSQSEDEWNRFDREGWEGGFFPKYKWQVSCYMYATNLPLCMVRVKRNKDGEIAGFAVDYIEEPFYSISQIRSKVLAVESLAAQGAIPDCESPAWGCPYWYLPEHGERVDKDRVELPDSEELEKIAVEYATAARLAKVNKDKVEALRPLLYSVVGENEKVSTVSGVKITRWEQNNPPSTDYAAMVKDGVISQDDIERYTRQTRGPRIRVTLPKGMRDD